MTTEQKKLILLLARRGLDEMLADFAAGEDHSISANHLEDLEEALTELSFEWSIKR